MLNFNVVIIIANSNISFKFKPKQNSRQDKNGYFHCGATKKCIFHFKGRNL